MKSIFTVYANCRHALAICMCVIPMLSGCAKANVPVSIHGVNYSAQTFSYVIEDPANSKNHGGGELIEPYSAGGAMCCYELPAKWQAGMKVKIIGRHWLPKKPDGSLPEIVETKIVEVPQYVDGKAGELWVLRGADGALSIVSSDYQPDHAKWPGRVKGWPVPSLEYRRARWDVQIEHEQRYVRLYTKMLKEMRESPTEHAEESWRYAKQKRPDSLAGFSGPSDEKYWAFLRQDYLTSLKEVQEKLKGLQEQRP